jgi:LysM repeat protein/FtsZ-binding cell division protein ZapB
MPDTGGDRAGIEANADAGEVTGPAGFLRKNGTMRGAVSLHLFLENVSPSCTLMLPRLLFGGALVALAFAPTASAQVEVANLREDVRGLMQRVGDLSLRIEQLERENGELRRKTAEVPKSAVTLAQLNDAILDLNRTIKSSVSASQNETLQIVSTQLEKLGKQTNAALESLAKSQAVKHVAAPAPAPVPAAAVGADDTSKDGTTYVVQKGDSLASIAKKTGAKQQDIVNANKISDPSLIKVGQTLTIPGGK